MAGLLGITTETAAEVKQLRAVEFCNGSYVTVAYAVAAISLVRGAVMGQITASKKWAIMDPDATDGSEVARGILGIPDPVTVAAGGPDVSVYMYAAGSYVENQIVWPAGISDENKAIAYQQLRDAGIVLCD